MRILLATAVAVAAVAFPALAAGGTSANAHGTFLVNGLKTFPLALTQPPPRGGKTSGGTDALDEVVSAGIRFLRAGASGSAWTSSTLADAQAWDAAAASRGAYTWINLRELAKAQPGTSAETMLRQVVTTLADDPGLGLWKGVDEPWWAGVPWTSLRYGYCLTTSRGDASWCDQSRSLDPNHLWVTIQAPRGTAADLQPYSAVTDTHGVDIYPIGIRISAPDLHQVGRWTSTLAQITPSRNVWTTLQICHSGSFDASGNFVLPTLVQERYMIYDAIINGARALNFYGGRNAKCFSSADAASGWNWTFWNGVLKRLVREIGPTSRLYPALLTPETAIPVTTNDPATQAIARRVGSNSIWVLAARSGTGTKTVALSGLPAWASAGSVYNEHRSVTATKGAWTDGFSQWAVHVYQFKTSKASEAR